jgi:hypothetical protein
MDIPLRKEEKAGKTGEVGGRESGDTLIDRKCPRVSKPKENSSGGLFRGREPRGEEKREKTEYRLLVVIRAE